VIQQKYQIMLHRVDGTIEEHKKVKKEKNICFIEDE